MSAALSPAWAMRQVKRRPGWFLFGALVVVGGGAALVLSRGKPVLSLAELVTLARKHGFSNPSVAAAVAMAESGGVVAVVGDRELGDSFGLWQIHHPSHPEYSTARLTKADYNADAAFAISRGGTNWSPWTTFRTGAYKRYLTG